MQRESSINIRKYSQSKHLSQESSGVTLKTNKMKVCLALLVLLPLAFCAEEAQLNFDLDSLTEEQKRFLFHLPSLDDVKNAICTVISSDAGHTTCEAACPIALAALPGGSLVASFCGPACSSIHC